MKYTPTPDCSTTRLLLNRLYQTIERTTHQDPHPGLIIGSHHFSEPYYPLINEVDVLCLATMDLLNQFAYPSISGYSKFSISFTMNRSYGEGISFTLGPAIPLTSSDGKLIPKSEVYAHIYQYIQKYADKYEGDYVTRIMIRVYLEGAMKSRSSLSSVERESQLSSIIEDGLHETEPITAREIRNMKRNYPSHITALMPSCKKLQPFIVADTETLMINGVQRPYAAGLMLVRPGEKIPVNMIDTYFSEEYSFFLDSFEDRSTKVLRDLVFRIETLARQEHSCLTVYFHNFGRFDGILLLKHLSCHHKGYKLVPLMRNNILYELVVCSASKKKLFRFRDSLHLLPGSLSSLAANLCPSLGSKGSIEYEKVTESSVGKMKEILLDYMKQDIRLLGGVMQKAQEIYWKLFQVDIESKITISSLALSIFRLKYYDASNWPIHIPNKNEDTFIRKAYYGGHTDVYKPYGENLYYYDVNSLYPFIMKEFPMPGGDPVWHGNLEGMELDSLFGFIEAYVVCPKTIKKPFLPYRDKNETLIFPTGEFIGVYYSEELKYARGIGYTVIPISGYLFEKMESPFSHFVTSLFESRSEAKKSGNEALSYVYKILMNSLYGRFGINPKSTITEVCDKDRYNELIRHTDFIFGDMLSENNYIVSYHSNTNNDSDHWNPPRNSAVQLAAAITASARIYMHPYISREDSYYTDTDSVVLGQPLPEEEVSSSVLGQFKLEDRIKKGIFLAPKAYCYSRIDGSDVLKFKGPAKHLVKPEWFVSQYTDLSRKELVEVSSNFRIDWHSLNIIRKDTFINLGIKQGTKRIPVYLGDVWVDTDPMEIKDLSGLNHIGKRIIKSLGNALIQLQAENEILNQKLSQKEREIEEGYKEMNEQKELFDARKNTGKRTQSTSLTEDRKSNDKKPP